MFYIGFAVVYPQLGSYKPISQALLRGKDNLEFLKFVPLGLIKIGTKPKVMLTVKQRSLSLIWGR